MSWLAFLGLSMAAASFAQAPDPGEARALWTIGSDDCVSVHADGEPWQECGFQAFAMNGDGSRILTVSSGGTLQLWDGEGREIRRLDWTDQPGGASGYPSGRTLIVGNLGVAVVHQNQLAVIDLDDGRVLSQTVADLMIFDEFLPTPERLLTAVRTRNWDRRIYALELPSGRMTEVTGFSEWTPLQTVARQVWLEGRRAPFVIHRARPARGAGQLRDCTPVEERYCLWHDLPGRFVHMADLATGESRSLDVGRELGQFDWVQFVLLDQPYFVICGASDPAYPPRRQCSIRRLADGAEIHAFETGHNLRVDKGLDEQGRPEFRLTLLFEPTGREQRRVSLDGRVRIIDPQGRANLAPPGGGLILPGSAEGTGLLVDRAGRPVARLPFTPQACGNGWPSWTAGCPISLDGRRWLLPISSPVEDGGPEDRRAGLTMFEMPVPPIR